MLCWLLFLSGESASIRTHQGSALGQLEQLGQVPQVGLLGFFFFHLLLCPISLSLLLLLLLVAVWVFCFCSCPLLVLVIPRLLLCSFPFPPRRLLQALLVLFDEHLGFLIGLHIQSHQSHMCPELFLRQLRHGWGRLACCLGRNGCQLFRSAGVLLVLWPGSGVVSSEGFEPGTCG